MAIQGRFDRLVAGDDPALVMRMPSGFLTMAAHQYLEGYCILLAYPRVDRLNDLRGAGRAQFLADMAQTGDAIIAATGAVRANYAIYGNLDPFLHAHIWPRFADEADDRRTLPPLSIPEAYRTDPRFAFDPVRHADLMERIRAAITDTER